MDVQPRKAPIFIQTLLEWLTRFAPRLVLLELLLLVAILGVLHHFDKELVERAGRFHSQEVHVRVPNLGVADGMLITICPISFAVDDERDAAMTVHWDSTQRLRRPYFLKLRYAAPAFDVSSADSTEVREVTPTRQLPPMWLLYLHAKNAGHFVFRLWVETSKTLGGFESATHPQELVPLAFQQCDIDVISSIYVRAGTWFAVFNLFFVIIAPKRFWKSCMTLGIRQKLPTNSATRETDIAFVAAEPAKVVKRSAQSAKAGQGIEIKSTVLFGPVAIPGADADLAPLLAQIVAVVSSGATNLVQYAANIPNERGAAQRLCALAALCASGELRALLLLCGSGLTMQARIHLRSLNDCLKRIVVYYKDQAFALETEKTLASFKAEGFAKLDDADRERLTKRDEETTRRFDQLMAETKPPPLITKNPEYKGPIGPTLDAFRYWAYGQVEHCTPIALAEISNRLSVESENIYFTEEGALLLIAASGMGIAITAYLSGLGISAKAECGEMRERLRGILKRSGLAGPDDETIFDIDVPGAEKPG